METKYFNIVVFDANQAAILESIVFSDDAEDIMMDTFEKLARQYFNLDNEAMTLCLIDREWACGGVFLTITQTKIIF